MNSPLLDFSFLQLVCIALIFVWTGFVRTGLGFGGAALGLPLMLFIQNDPVFWLPIIGLHLLFFTSLTLRTRINNVDWQYLQRTSGWIVPAALVGVLGLINLPTTWLVIFIYGITLFYALLWMFSIVITSNSRWTDRLLLGLGGYVAGTSLTGAPLIISVFMRNVTQDLLRNTLFVLWFILVAIKMSAFALLGVSLQWQSALLLLPIAAIGHVIGLKVHDYILKNDAWFKRFIGGALVLISVLGLWQVYSV